MISFLYPQEPQQGHIHEIYYAAFSSELAK